LVIRRASFIPAAVVLVVVAGCGADGSPSASPSVSPEPSVSAAPLATATLAPATAQPTPAATASAGTTTYVLRKGDTLAAIAKKFKITLAALRKANPQVTDPTKIRPGDKLTIPAP
jgi:LysM repeat protein